MRAVDQHERWKEGHNDAQPDVLPGFPGAQNAFKDSMIHEVCNSHYLSQFAAFFIVARAKRSVVKSCLLVIFMVDSGQGYRKEVLWGFIFLPLPKKEKEKKIGRGGRIAPPGLLLRPPGPCTCKEVWYDI